jgi:Sulfotransferase domain
MNMLPSLIRLSRVGITHPTHRSSGAVESELVESSGEASQALRLLYIAGLARSGSTVLGYVLGELPGAIFVGELALFWRRFAEGELCSCSKPLPDCHFWSAVVSEAFGQMTCEHARRLQELEWRVTRQQRLLGLVPVRWSTRWSKKIRIMLAERDRLYRAISEIASAECIVDSGKEVTFGSMMARLSNINFSTIHLVRDPRGVAFSWQKQVRSDSEPGYMPRSTAIRTAARWMSGNIFVQLSLRKLSSAYYRVRYEDLVAYPSDIAHEISRATSNPVTSNERADYSVQLPNEYHLVGSNPGVRRHLGRDLRLTLDDEWRTGLPRGQSWLVTAVCGGLMTAYDYPLRKRHHS